MRICQDPEKFSRFRFLDERGYSVKIHFVSEIHFGRDFFIYFASEFLLPKWLFTSELKEVGSTWTCPSYAEHWKSRIKSTSGSFRALIVPNIMAKNKTKPKMNGHIPCWVGSIHSTVNQTVSTSVSNRRSSVIYRLQIDILWIGKSVFIIT